jgi:pimeloyl-ACP methyl ester carboxylesterase
MPARKSPPSRRPPNPPTPPEVIDPVWLLKALGITIVAAVICAYLALCGLYYQGEWQLVLHPTRTINATPATVGLAYTPVSFDAAETGQPRLTGWLVPAAGGGRYAAFTVLYLHDGSGSLSDTVPMLARLHSAGLNVFAFDYRGFGQSDAAQHPSEERMMQDADAALSYLTDTRHADQRTIIPYGAGLGASLAATLAANHSALPVVILDNPDPDPASTAYTAHPSPIVPVRMLFGRQFQIAPRLASLATPKLLIAGGPGQPTPDTSKIPLQALFRQAASPKTSVTLPPANSQSEYAEALKAFLDQYLNQHPQPMP